MKRLLIFLFLIGLFSGCEKEDEFILPIKGSERIKERKRDYWMLKVGNYWIYQRFNIDANGTATATNIFDSCYVSEEVFINGYKFYRIVKPFANSYTDMLVRDSSHYVMNSYSRKIFSYLNYPDPLENYYIFRNGNIHDTMYTVQISMCDKNMVTETPYGKLLTYNGKYTFNIHPPYVSGGGPVMDLNYRYAENIGLVVETLPRFISLTSYVERRLVRFRVR